IGLDYFKDVKIIQNKILEPTSNNLESNCKTVRESRCNKCIAVHHMKYSSVVKIHKFFNFSFRRSLNLIPSLVRCYEQLRPVMFLLGPSSIGVTISSLWGRWNLSSASTRNSYID